MLKTKCLIYYNFIDENELNFKLLELWRNIIKILLLGCTGVGKTTIGKLLSENIDFTFYDIDYVIKANYGTNPVFQVLFGTIYERYLSKTKITKRLIQKAPKNLSKV